MMIKIYEQKCDGCGLCVDACKEGAIYLIDNVASIDQDRCKECGNCIEVCPAQAIYSELPEKGPQYQQNVQPTAKQEIIASVKSKAVKIGKTLLPLALSGIADMIISKLDRSDQPTVLKKQNEFARGKRSRQRRRQGKA